MVKMGSNTEVSPSPHVGEQLINHFYKTYTRNVNKNKIGFPDYLTNFKKEPRPETQIHLEQYRNGEYDLVEEEKVLTALGTLVGVNNAIAHRLISNKLGLTALD